MLIASVIQSSKVIKYSWKLNKQNVTMLKIQMLEQIVTNDSVADEEQNNDAEQSTSRTPINLSPQRNGLVILFASFSLFVNKLNYF